MKTFKFIAIIFVILNIVLVVADDTQNDVTALRQEVVALKKLLAEKRKFYEEKLISLQKELNGLISNRNGIKKRAQDAVSQGIAFYLQLSHDIPKLGDHQTILYDDVQLNMGSGYNKIDGIFRAPVAGVYVFNWMTTNADRSFMNTELVLNAQVRGKAMSDAYNHNDYAVATNVAVLKLKLHDEVWVRTGTWHSGIVRGSDYTTFSGYLLYPEAESTAVVIG